MGLINKLTGERWDGSTFNDAIHIGEHDMDQFGLTDQNIGCFFSNSLGDTVYYNNKIWHFIG